MKAQLLGKSQLSNQIKKIVNTCQVKSPTLSFGPHMLGQKPFEVRSRVKKLIHYDCKDNEDVNDEVPNEDEIYIKGSLLKKTDNPE